MSDNQEKNIYKLLNHFNILNKKYIYILLISLICLELFQIILIFILFRKIILIIFLEIIIQYLFLYIILHKLIFGGNSILITRYNCWRLGMEISKIFGEKLGEFKNSFEDFYSKNETKNIKFNMNELYSKSEKLNSINDLIFSYLKLSNTVEEKKMSSYQKDMVVSLNKLKMSIEESNLIKIVSDTIIRVFRNQQMKFWNTNLDTALDQIKSQIDIILIKIKNFQLKNSNLLKNIQNFLFNDTFGSLIQLKKELLSRYYCESFKIKTNDNNKNNIDCLLIKYKSISNDNKRDKIEKDKIKESIIEVNEEEKETKINEITKPVIEEIINKEGDKKMNQREENNKNTVIIICNNFLYPYELASYYHKFIDYYLNLGINIILWNYRGYGESTGYPMLSNIQKDAEQLIKHIKIHYNFTNIGVHGINLGGLPASYLCSQNLVNFCFIDKCFNSLYEYFNENINKYFHYLLKIVFINDFDLSLLLNQNIKRQNEKNIYKIISYSLKKDFFDHDISLKNMIAKDFVFKILNTKETLLKIILFNGGNKYEYDLFIKNLYYIIEKIIYVNNNKEDNKKDEDEIIETINDKITIETVDENKDSIDSGNRLDIEFDKSKHNQEIKIFSSLKELFEKFDAGGETLLSLFEYKKNINFSKKEKIINNFFTNLFSWGSYKIGKEYATELLVAYKAIEKKLSYVNRRINKIISEPKKYIINDMNLTLALKNLAENFDKIESFFNDKFINKEINFYKKDKKYEIDSANNSFSSRENDSSYRININDVFNKNLLEENSKVIEFIEGLNIGNLLILNTENYQQYNDNEIKMLTLFLINSNFIK